MEKTKKTNCRQLILLVNFKQCSLCKKFKNHRHFPRNNASKDGLYTQCRLCMRKKRYGVPIENALQPYLSGFMQCTKCKEWLTTDNFYKNDYHSNGFNATCKPCKLKMCRVYSLQPHAKKLKAANAAMHRNTEKYKQRRKRYRGKDRVKEMEREYSRRRRLKPEFKEWSREYRAKPEVKKRRTERRIARESSPEYKIRKAAQLADFEIKEKLRAYNAAYRLDPINNARIKARSLMPDKIERRRFLANARMANNPILRINRNVGSAICRSLKRGSKGRQRWESLVGFNLKQLRRHLEKQFPPDMSWDNYGEWHIDHIIPKSAFNFSDPSHVDFKRCWALKNLQPLWKKDNLSKHNKLEKPFQPCLAFGLASDDVSQPIQ